MIKSARTSKSKPKPKPKPESKEESWRHVELNRDESLALLAFRGKETSGVEHIYDDRTGPTE